MKAFLAITLFLLIAFGVGYLALFHSAGDSESVDSLSTTKKPDRRGGRSSSGTNSDVEGPSTTDESVVDSPITSEEDLGGDTFPAKPVDVEATIEQLRLAIELGDFGTKDQALALLASVEGLDTNPSILALLKGQEWTLSSLVLRLPNFRNQAVLTQLFLDHPPESAAPNRSRVGDDGYSQFLTALFEAVAGRGDTTSRQALFDAVFDGALPESQVLGVFAALKEADASALVAIRSSAEAWLGNATGAETRKALFVSLSSLITRNDFEQWLILAKGSEEEALVLLLAAQANDPDTDQKLATTLQAKCEAWKEALPAEAFQAFSLVAPGAALEFARARVELAGIGSRVREMFFQLLAAGGSVGDQEFIQNTALGDAVGAAEAAKALLSNQPAKAESLFLNGQSDAVRSLAIAQLLSGSERESWIARGLDSNVPPKVRASVVASLDVRVSAERAQLAELAGAEASVRVREAAIRRLLKADDALAITQLEALAASERQPSLRTMMQTRIAELRELQDK